MFSSSSNVYTHRTLWMKTLWVYFCCRCFLLPSLDIYSLLYIFPSNFKNSKNTDKHILMLMIMESEVSFFASALTFFLMLVCISLPRLDSFFFPPSFCLTRSESLDVPVKKWRRVSQHTVKKWQGIPSSSSSSFSSVSSLSSCTSVWLIFWRKWGEKKKATPQTFPVPLLWRQ